MKPRQLKVSTKAYNAMQKRKKINDYLRTENLGASPMNVAFYTKIKHNTVKSLLIKMVNDGELKKLERPRGYYALVENQGHSIFLWNFHNLIITSILNDLNIEEDVTDKNIANDVVNYELLICKETKKATFRLNTDYPQNFLAIIPIIWLFQKIVLSKTGIEPSLENIEIRTNEFNQDEKKLRIDGANAITYTELMEQIKLYNKDQGLRKEIKTTVPFTAETLFALLHGGTVALQNARYNNELLELIRDIRNQLKVDKKTNQKLFQRILQKDNKHKINPDDYL